MKDTHVLCIACLLTLIAIAAVFVGYATNRLPMYTPRHITTAPPATINSAQAATDIPAGKRKLAAAVRNTPQHSKKR